MCTEAKIRNVIFAINIILDGCCDHTKQIGDEEIHEYFTRLMRDVDLLVFRRKTYQLTVPFGPKSPPEDRNTRIVRTNLRDEILKLKQERGKNILIGGVSIPSQLIELGLIDEYRLAGLISQSPEQGGGLIDKYKGEEKAYTCAIA